MRKQKKLLDTGLGNFLDMTLNAQATKAKTSGTTSNKSFCTAKETIKGKGNL